MNHSPLILGTAFLLLSTQGNAQTCIQRQTVPGGSTAIQFGNSCDLEGDLAAIGARNDNTGALIGGGVHIYRENPTSKAYRFVTSVQGSDATGSDNFGQSVDMDGDRMVVGAPTANGTMSNIGQAYVFDRTPGTDTWVEQAILFPPVPNSQASYGSEVAVSGDRVCIGASGDAFVYVYLRDSLTGVWAESQILQPTGSTATSPRFGKAIAMDGERLVVGAWNAKINGIPGAAYVYTWNPATEEYVQDQILQGDEIVTSSGDFGWDVAIDGDRLAVSEPTRDSGGETAAGGGFVYDYDNTTQTWELTQALAATIPVAGDRVGENVALRGDVAVLGARFAANPGTTFTGAQQTYDWDGNLQAWQARPIQYLPDTTSNQWPQSVAVNSGVVLAAGLRSAYFFRDDSPDCNGNGIGDLCELFAETVDDFNGNWVPDVCETIGFAYCAPAVPNVAGMPSTTIVLGSPVAANNAISLRSFDLPTNRFAFYLAGQGTTIVNQPPGSVGNLCIAGAPIGRLNATEQILNSGSLGQVVLDVDITNLAQPNGPTTVVAGETWYFQLWHRDATGSSNFSDARGVAFQ